MILLLTVVFAAGFGGLAGASLPVPVHRLAVRWIEDEERFERTRDRCAGCEREFAPGVRGWLALGPHCDARLGPPTWLLAALGAAGAAALAARIGPRPELPVYLFGMVLALLLGTVDWLAQRLPDAVVYPGIGASALLFGVVAVVERDFGGYVRTLVAAAVLFVVYLLIAILPGAPLGAGDLGLAALLALYLGWRGWTVLGYGAALPWLLQAAGSVVVLARRRGTRRTLLPFGPALVTGAFLALLLTE